MNELDKHVWDEMEPQYRTARQISSRLGVLLTGDMGFEDVADRIWLAGCWWLGSSYRIGG